MAAFASQQSIDGLEDTSYYQNELDRIRNRGASIQSNALRSKQSGTDNSIGNWLDFYNKQKSPIYDGKGNQIGFDHGYGVRENWAPQKPGDDKWISDEEWEQLKKEPSPPADQQWPDREPPGGIDWTQPINQDPPVGAAPGTRVDNDGRNLIPDDTRGGRGDYGSRVGVDLPPGTGFTMDWRDGDGDGIDDRHQRGPGQPDEGPWSNRERDTVIGPPPGGWGEDRMPAGWGGSGTPPRRGESMEEYNRRMQQIEDRWNNRNREEQEGRRPPRWRGDDQIGPGDPKPPVRPGLPRPPEGDWNVTLPVEPPGEFPYPMPGPRPPIDGDPGPRPPRPEIPPIHGDPGPRPPIGDGWTPGKPIVSKEQEVIESFYNNILRRGSDQQGMDYWLGQAEGGMSLADIEKSIANSAEAQKVFEGRPPNIGQPGDDPDLDYPTVVPFGDDQFGEDRHGDDFGFDGPRPGPSDVVSWGPGRDKPGRDKYPAFDDKGQEIKYDEQNRPTTNPGVGDEDYRNVHITYAEGFEPTPEEHRQNQKKFWTKTQGPLTRLGIKRQEEAQRLDRQAQELRAKRGDRPMEKKAAKERAETWQREPRQPVAQPTPRREDREPRKSQQQVNREREVRRMKERAGDANREAIVRSTPRAPVAAPAPSRPAPKPAKSDWLEQAYQSNLGRSADAGGKAYWAKEVASGRQTQDQVIANIRRSDEYKNRNR